MSGALGLIPGDCKLSYDIVSGVCIYSLSTYHSLSSPPLLHKLHSQEQGKLTSGLGGRLDNSFGGLAYLRQGRSLVIRNLHCTQMHVYHICDNLLVQGFDRVDLVCCTSIRAHYYCSLRNQFKYTAPKFTLTLTPPVL